MQLAAAAAQLAQIALEQRVRVEADAVAIGDAVTRVRLQQRAELVHAARVEPLERRRTSEISASSASSAARSSSRAWISTGIRRPSGTSLKPSGGEFEEGAAGERQRPDQPVAERIMEHGRASARRVEADLLLGLEHGDPRMLRQARPRRTGRRCRRR